ncbi:hypothetical protein Rhe02_18600 [Rhizocola hellebori]|uniref:Uncharacterized protein n=1 Tax=Rhizocola hellebori TaxID=1392758 RepID=A0A8J3VFE0_9ACTN|nr:hypothetical protein [Rhizocola hellebori]GIH03793.1 hypothetical protein Rhe02_18600 [Rhizocola hellebori]
MPVGDIQPPVLLPLLSRGKHRNPRKGACFMELASFLAGQRWSDHPACTHPLLAALARLVNDCTTDANRQRLAALIPSVIGLTSEDLQMDAQIALRCGSVALPVVAADRQPAMAVAILTAQRVLADLGAAPSPALAQRSAQALADVPAAAHWAKRFIAGRLTTPKAFRRNAAPSVASCAVIGIAQACIPDPDTILHDLLADAIDDCRLYIERHAAPVSAPPHALLHDRS